jgi:hypothetical protein
MIAADETHGSLAQATVICTRADQPRGSLRGFPWL